MSKEKKRRGRSAPPRLKDYYYNPPYGCRYWILMPFMDENDHEFHDKTMADLGELNLRPMFQIEF